jgi:MFS family permease
MLRILISLSALIAAASLVTLANATMTTIMPLRLLQDGADEATVALFGAAYFAGFTVGCFSQPPRILRVGYIRAFAAAAAICTTFAIVMDLTDSPAVWIVLRFGMGLCIAAIFASVDGWINAATPDAMRGSVYSAYGWCIGAAAVLGQFMLVAWDGLAVGFITILALAFNVAVTLVTLTRASAPPSAPPRPAADEPSRRGDGVLAFTSATAVLAAIYTGLVVTAILATLPAILAQAGITDSVIGIVIGSYFIGRLVLQIPIGVIADRMDLRLLIAIVSGLTGVVAVLAWFLIVTDAAAIAEGSSRLAQVTFLAVSALLGGLTLPLYTLAVALAYARAAGQSAVRIATTLLLVNSAGAVAGPILVAALIPFFGWDALILVTAVTSALMAGFAIYRHTVTRRHAPAPSMMSDVPATSVELSQSIGEVKQAEAQTVPAPEAPGDDAPRPTRDVNG